MSGYILPSIFFMHLMPVIQVPESMYPCLSQCLSTPCNIAQPQMLKTIINGCKYCHRIKMLPAASNGRGKASHSFDISRLADVTLNLAEGGVKKFVLCDFRDSGPMSEDIFDVRMRYAVY